MKPIVETLQTGPNRSFFSAGVTWRDMSGYIGWHLHPEYEITYWSHGRGTLFVGDNILEVKGGDLVFIGPDLPISYTEDDHPEEEFGSKTVVFDPIKIFGDILSLPELRRVDELLKRGKRGLKFPAIDDEVCIANLTNAVHGKGLTRYTALLHTLDRLSGITESSPLVSEGFLTDEEEFNARRMSKIVGFVKNNLADDITQSDLANELGMTPSSFSRFFKNATGRTFVSFVNLIRTSEACKQLIYSDEDITNIAFACGYSNLSNFNRHFRELRGMTPTQYRKQHRR